MVFRLIEQDGFDFCVEADSKAQVRKYFSTEHYDLGEPEPDALIYDLKDACSLFGSDDR